MDVSIVVLFTREPAMAERCLRAIEAARGDRLETELVLVLNAAPAATRDVVRALAPDARVIESAVNTGTNAGWNLAFGAARGRYVALLHEDSAPRAGWLDALVATADAHPRAAVIGSRLLYPDGRIWSMGSALWDDGHPTMLNADRWPAGVAVRAPYPVDTAASASMLVDRDAWRAIGGFDERFFPAMYTETDFCAATWLSGRTVVADPMSVVVHETGAMVRKDRGALGSSRFQEFLWKRARERLVRKWGDSLGRFAPLRPGESAFSTTPADVERAIAAARDRADALAAGGADVRNAAQERALTAPEGGYPTSVDAPMAARLDAAQRAAEREFADWLLAKLREAEAAFEWMTGQRDAAAEALARTRDAPGA